MNEWSILCLSGYCSVQPGHLISISQCLSTVLDTDSLLMTYRCEEITFFPSADLMSTVSAKADGWRPLWMFAILSLSGLSKLLSSFFCHFVVVLLFKINFIKTSQMKTTPVQGISRSIHYGFLSWQAIDMERQLSHYAHTKPIIGPTNGQSIKHLSFALWALCHFACHSLV